LLPCGRCLRLLFQFHFTCLSESKPGQQHCCAHVTLAPCLPSLSHIGTTCFVFLRASLSFNWHPACSTRLSDLQLEPVDCTANMHHKQSRAQRFRRRCAVLHHSAGGVGLRYPLRALARWQGALCWNAQQHQHFHVREPPTFPLLDVFWMVGCVLHAPLKSRVVPTP
jgi:hypothetical protein